MGGHPSSMLLHNFLPPNGDWKEQGLYMLLSLRREVRSSGPAERSVCSVQCGQRDAMAFGSAWSQPDSPQWQGLGRLSAAEPTPSGQWRGLSAGSRSPHRQCGLQETKAGGSPVLRCPELA